jgi:predicted TIM-barrel fold metal-dependent hydrolase
MQALIACRRCWQELATTTLSDDEKIAILGGNAAKLFGLDS